MNIELELELISKEQVGIVQGNIVLSLKCDLSTTSAFPIFRHIRLEWFKGISTYKVIAFVRVCPEGKCYSAVG